MGEITVRELKELHEAAAMAREDDTPFAVVDKDSIMVYGDANKTKKKETGFSITFRFLEDELNKVPENATRFAGCVQFSTKFEHISVNPRDNIKLVEYCLELVPFVNEVDDIKEEIKAKAEELNKKYGFERTPESPEDFFELPAQAKDEYSDLQRQQTLAVLHAYNGYGESLQLACYNLVATVLEISDFMASHMTALSVFKGVVEIISTYPELFNESETLFSA